MTKKIILVEDVDHNRTLITTILKLSDYQIIELESGHNLVEITQKEKPDLILMDIQLPEISGTDLTKKLKENSETQHIPIIAVTAFAMENDKERILASGCDDYLAKPFKANELEAIVAKHL